jgi:16S rRNA (guanine527-N7)-methyltransferase
MLDKRLEALAVPEPARNAVQGWLDLLREWNKRMDLTAARNDDELFDLMLADALALAPHMPADARVVDIGCGAGAPGLALALVRPDLRVTLVEPLTKRVAFLRTVLGTLGRTDIVLVKEKGEATAARSSGAWDVALSRATLAPDQWIPLGLRLAPIAWALLAREDAPEFVNAKHADELSYVWPLTHASRRAVRYERIERGP